MLQSSISVVFIVVCSFSVAELPNTNSTLENQPKAHILNLSLNTKQTRNKQCGKRSVVLLLSSLLK